MSRPWKYTYPDEYCRTRGTKLFCQIDRGTSHTGSVRNEQGEVCWRYGPGPSIWSLKNPFKKADFVIADSDARNEVIIRRESFIPPVFNIVAKGRIVGAIRLISIFRNRYSISIDGANPLVFCMPLYRMFFFGASNLGIETWVRIHPTEREWNILLKPGSAQWPLIAALAFIHNERYRYG